MPVHPVVVDPRIPVVVGVDDPVSWRAGQAFPADLALLWPVRPSLVGVRSSAVGHDLTWSYTGNMYDADGVSIGANPPFHGKITKTHGPNFTSVVAWEDGGTRVWEITMSKASSDLVGDVEIGGGLYANSAGLKFSDGTNAATAATSWGVGGVVTAVVYTMHDGVRGLMRLEVI